ncbi:hypothetical protein EUGRSUZ_L00553 [Eucalyptus grandis]|uniref:Pentacotripeptide-repeat region of PRORP domain-containing protein n=3 Tax=Eucalyptus grandis TaxID=71139 RepID=A0AAD9WJ85_EUCGR|nr:hypothetical protein EUGRSUZ_L00553 [Eucalyptus grandis]
MDRGTSAEELGRLKDFGYRPTQSTYNALVQVFLKADRLDTAYLVHREMSDSGFHMDGRTLGCFAYSLCKSGKWREALALIESEEFLPDTVLYTKMIAGLCEASLFDEAMEFLDRMRSNSCIPNVVTYNVLLSGCLRKRQLGRCKRIINMMIPEGCYPGHQIFVSLVHAFCNLRDYSYAYKLLKKMVKCGYRPGYVVYNVLLGGLCGNEELPGPDVLELAENTYNEMVDAGVVLNKVNVANFARCLCGAGKFEKAHCIIREMMSKGFIPDCSTYSKVISFLCDASKVDKAFTLFEEMKSNGVVPDVYTYTILIDSFCKAGLIEQACRWFDEMVRDGCAPNVVTYTALIHAHLKMKLTYWPRHVAGYRKVIEGFNRDFIISLGLLDDMGASNSVPLVSVYNVLIDNFVKAGRLEVALDLHEEIRSSLVSLAGYKTVYASLIESLSLAGKVDKAFELYADLIKQGGIPKLSTFVDLIRGLVKVHKWDEVLQLSDCLCQMNIVLVKDEGTAVKG